MKKTVKIISAALVLVMMFMIVGCASTEDKIVGTWSRQETGLLGIVTETTYTFNEDGTGKGVLGASFTYTVEGDTVNIVYSLLDSIEVSNETYTVSFSGDTLTMTKGDQSYIYTKKAQ